jgi:hypothetical protein
VAEAILSVLTDNELWARYSQAGRDNINAYSWPSHCIKCLRTVEEQKVRARVVCVWCVLCGVYVVCGVWCVCLQLFVLACVW